MYLDCDLRLIYEYFWDDLIYIVESLDTHRLLSELKSHDIPKLEVMRSFFFNYSYITFQKLCVHLIIRTSNMPKKCGHLPK